MKYTYVCTSCIFETIIDIPLGQDLPKDVVCEKCNATMKHNLFEQLKEATHTIIIPESFKATSTLYDKQKYYGKHRLHEKKLY